MKVLSPTYCQKFKCIAGSCKHSCCVGWQIEIDNASLKKYLTEKSEIGDKLRKNIIQSEEVASFRLTKDDRCPFLDDKHLCQLIISKDEKFICDICKEHPRFYNEYENHTEMGLGMCCEEATRLILNEKFELNYVSGKTAKRQEIIDFIFNDKMPFDQKIEFLLNQNGIELDRDASKWANVLSKLEILDNNWKQYISLLNSQKRLILPENKEFYQQFERIAAYFIYRWYNSDLCLNENCLCEYYSDEIMGFIILSVLIISTIFGAGDKTTERLGEICRIYSSEIEYSDENPVKLIDIIFDM